MSRKESDTRSKILLATQHAMEADPARAPSMGQIAKAAGISRQALYLHFPSRAELFIETTRDLDRRLGVEDKLRPVVEAKSGSERLAAFIAVWAAHLPRIHGVVTALMRLKDSDEAAAAAWQNRMQAIRASCQRTVEMLHADGKLNSQLTPQAATDLLWMLMSVENWERLTQDCGWSQADYVEHMRAASFRLLTDE